MRKILTIICTLFSLLQLHSQTEQDIISEANRLKISSRQEAISALSDKGISESQAKEMARIRGIDFEVFLADYLKSNAGKSKVVLGNIKNNEVVSELKVVPLDSMS